MSNDETVAAIKRGIGADVGAGMPARNFLIALEGQDVHDVRRLVGAPKCQGCGTLVPERAEPPADMRQPTLFGWRPEECQSYFAFIGREKDRIHDMGWKHLIFERGHFNSVGGWICPECWRAATAPPSDLQDELARVRAVAIAGLEAARDALGHSVSCSYVQTADYERSAPCDCGHDEAESAINARIAEIKGAE